MAGRRPRDEAHGEVPMVGNLARRGKRVAGEEVKFRGCDEGSRVHDFEDGEA